MASVYTIDGVRRKRRGLFGFSLGDGGASCKRVRTRGRGCSIEICQNSRGRWRFQKGTRRCR